MRKASLLSFDISAFSYSCAFLAFLILSLLLLGNRRVRQYARALGVACVLTSAWACGVVGLELLGLRNSLLADLFEVLHSAIWLVFLLMLFEPYGLRRNALFCAVAIASGVQLIAAASSSSSIVVMVARLLLAVLGMLLVEQWYRNTSASLRWGVKFACLGVGGLFAYDFYLYSEALLFRDVNDEIWAARGIVNALTAPLIGLSAARNPTWALELSVSRQIVFRSAALLGSAIYLLAMASSAYYLRYFGGAWGPVMQLAYMVGAVLVLAGVLFSGTSRANLKVFISKNFYKAIFDYREEWMRFTRTVSAAGPALGERAIEAIAQLVESPAGALWVRREHGFCEPVASWNMPPQTASEPMAGALCQFLETKQWVIDIADYRAHPASYAQLSMPAWLGALPQLWLIVPLMLHGSLFGYIVLARARASISLNWEVTDLLKIAGNQAASYLAHRASVESLAVARQFESFNRMSTFIVHDLKNLVLQLSLLLSNAERHKANPAFQQDMLETLDYSVKKMTSLLQKLSRDKSQELSVPVQLDQLLAQAVAAHAAYEPAPTLEIIDPGLTVLANAARLERVLGHLIQNAVEATAKDGRVALRLLREGGDAVVELRDTGQGMSAGFIAERLFKPFESTKTAGMGIGAFESREYILEVGGRLEVNSEIGVGTMFRVILPRYSETTRWAGE